MIGFLLFFVLGVIVTENSVTRGPGGRAILKFGKDFGFSIEVNEVNFVELFRQKANRLLILEEIEKLPYDDVLSDWVRRLSVELRGPFDYPEQPVSVTFKDNYPVNTAEVCPSGPLYNKMIILVPDGEGGMVKIDNASKQRLIGCANASDTTKPQPVVISASKGRELLRRDQLPETVQAIARPFPPVIYVPNSSESKVEELR